MDSNQTQDRTEQRETTTKKSSGRGFASMSREKQREIASKGGKAAHRQGVAHQFTPDEARAAGRKGGEAVSRNREHMAEIGRRGGEASRSNGRAERNGERNDENRNAPGNGSAE